MVGGKRFTGWAEMKPNYRKRRGKFAEAVEQEADWYKLRAGADSSANRGSMVRLLQVYGHA